MIPVMNQINTCIYHHLSRIDVEYFRMFQFRKSWSICKSFTPTQPHPLRDYQISQHEKSSKDSNTEVSVLMPESLHSYELEN